MTGRREARELPLRIVDQPGGAVIRCLCGRELAQVRRRSAADIVRPTSGRYEARSLAGLSPDISAAGLAVMVAHALQCTQSIPCQTERRGGKEKNEP